MAPIPPLETEPSPPRQSRGRSDTIIHRPLPTDPSPTRRLRGRSDTVVLRPLPSLPSSSPSGLRQIDVNTGRASPETRARNARAALRHLHIQIPATFIPRTTNPLLSASNIQREARLNPFVGGGIGRGIEAPAVSPLATGSVTLPTTLSEDFMNSFNNPENQSGLFGITFEKIMGKCFGTEVELQFTRNEGREELRTIKLVFDLFVQGPESAVKFNEEVQMRVNAWHHDRPVANLRGFAKSSVNVRRKANGELEYNIVGGLLEICNIEVSTEFTRRGLGREMVELLIGQARAHGLKTLELYPCSFRGDGLLRDGRDRATVFWESLGFRHDTSNDSEYQVYHRLQL